MYKDLITYELANGVTTEQLTAVAEKIVRDWMRHLDGFIKWEINANSDGTFTDIVYWESKEASKASNEKMADMPHAAEWQACYKAGSISSKNLTLIAGF